MPQKTDYQVCQKCGTVFARRDVEDLGFITGMNTYDHPTMCPKCGGKVVWQGSPEVGPSFARGCLPVLFLIGVSMILLVCSI
ncbi:MAG: hypothetical protein C4583_03480 [Anaerolineaceae bacterium]|nr:MAG: hypothetical protein C4583_03480 [Anaerolineaceae bacterium]